MIIGVPQEIKNNENRVALTPGGAQALVAHGHEVLIQTQAGVGSGFPDGSYVKAGAQIAQRAEAVFGAAEMIMKVKEPQVEEYAVLKRGTVLFTYLHLAAAAGELTEVLMEKKIAAVAYETVQLANAHLPLLQPMSEVAGRAAVQIGAHFLEKPNGGLGILLGGVPGVPPGHVVILGGGVVGLNAAQMAIGLGADVTILDISADRLTYIDNLYGNRMKKLMSNTYNIAESVRHADLLVGAVLIPGAKCPHLVTESMVKTMRPGSVIVDVAIDQGGSIETIDRATTHSDPIYVKHDVIHYAVGNIPGVVPRTSTLALTNVTLPYAMQLADKGFVEAVRSDPALGRGVNTFEGCCTHQEVAAAVNQSYTSLESLVRG